MLKCDMYKRPLLHKRINPTAFAEIKESPDVFQGYEVRKIGDISFPFILENDALIIDFGDHYTGYLHMELDNEADSHIADSPTNIVFNFAEMPIELAEDFKGSDNSLSVGWIQRDFKTVPFMPYSGSLERRYSFRYLEIKRVDSVRFPVRVTALYIDSVSSVTLENAKKVDISDPLLKGIDSMCIKTLAECEQEVFEDGPKRDRRLWIGDLRLQALVDFESFGNTDLIKRCIYLFAEHLNRDGLVAPCVFPDTPPYVDEWIYLDYSLCLILCLYDFMQNTGDTELVGELYDIAVDQIKYADKHFSRERALIDAPFFIDHARFDKSAAALGYFSYVLRRMLVISERLGKPCDWLEAILSDCDTALLSYYDSESGFFAVNGEISPHSQTWAALSGALSKERAAELLTRTENAELEIGFSSPFMMHYYLEAMFENGMREQSLECIRSFWGAIAAAGFDCCPECFKIGDERLSPYGTPVLNSACHAWSCTPAYWIRRFY